MKIIKQLLHFKNVHLINILTKNLSCNFSNKLDVQKETKVKP